LPPGVLNIVTGDVEVGNAISQHNDIDKIVFTGSTPTGKKIMQSASVNLKRLTLELGGNDAGIVLADVDVKAIAPKLFGVAFHNNGQTCACLKRLYVHESIYDDMCAELTTLANSAVVGNGLEEGVELGPIQNRNQWSIVKSLLEDARAQGGEVLCGGPVDDSPTAEKRGYFFLPTLVKNISDGTRLVDEEQFGPILPIIRYSDIAEVIERANRNQSGLGGSIWSSDLEKATVLSRQLECGTVWINDHGSIQPNAPFGGIKQSGFGVEFGPYGLEEYCSLQTVKLIK
jgi:acyl-CoA reductase-like NAD-dependent aldehyde dehydrogenase